MIGTPSGGKGGHGAIGRLGAGRCFDEREAFAHDPFDVRRLAVVEHGAVRSNDRRPAEGRGAGQKGPIEILPAVLPAKLASLPAMGDLNDLAAAGGESARRGRVETFARVPPEPDERQAWTQGFVAEMNRAVGIPNPALRQRTAARELRARAP